MSLGAELLTGLVLFLVAWLGYEIVRHRRALARIPVRIHVNGTRGKSSVTRLLAAGLRADDKRVIAKTTGTLARVILPNRTELSVFRPQGANIREQIRIVRFAADQKAEVLVVECMALQPILQWLSEKMFVRATHGVITNARPDHLDVMGPDPEDVAKALAGMMPRRAVCFTAEREHVPILAHAAKDRGSELVVTGAEDEEALTEEEMEGFRYYEHRENVALALRVCEALDVDRETALSGMKDSYPDPGALTFHELSFFGRHITFVNAFAANDPISSERLWDLCRAQYPDYRPVCVFNCRADRPDRSRQLGEALAKWSPPEQVVVVGTGTVFFARAAVAAGFDGSRLRSVEGAGSLEVFERLLEVCGRKTLVVGLGNIGGLGLDLVRLFRNRSMNSPELEEVSA